MRKLRILIADDHRLMLSAIRLAFEGALDFEIVGQASVGSEVLPLTRSTAPDVVLLDLKMPQMDGLACLEHLRKRFPNVRTIVLSGVEDPTVVRTAFRHGATAYILKRINPLDLPAAVRQALDGTFFQVFAEASEHENVGAREAQLTGRELAVLQLLADGKTNKQIASELFLAVQTVKFHLTSLYRKLDAGSRTEAVREAYRRGVLDAPVLEHVG